MRNNTQSLQVRIYYTHYMKPRRPLLSPSGRWLQHTVQVNNKLIEWAGGAGHEYEGRQEVLERLRRARDLCPVLKWPGPALPPRATQPSLLRPVLRSMWPYDFDSRSLHEKASAHPRTAADLNYTVTSWQNSTVTISASYQCPLFARFARHPC
jgi:hypothetical protein